MRLSEGLAAITLAAMLAGCTEKPVQPGGGEKEDVMKQVSFNAESPVSWSIGDHVAVFAEEGRGSDFTVKSIGFGGKTAVLAGKVPSDPDRTSISLMHPYLEGWTNMEDLLYSPPREQDPDKYYEYVHLTAEAEVAGDDFSQVTAKMVEHTAIFELKIENPSQEKIVEARIVTYENYTAKFSSPRDEATITARFVILPTDAREYEISVFYANASSESFRIVPSSEAVAGARLRSTVTLGKGVFRDIVDQGWFYGSPFDGVPDTDHMKIYEVSPRIFASEGSLKAVKNRLGAISELGANVIWLMPVFEQSEVRKPFGSPYSMKDFYKISPEYGTLEDLQNLVSEAHRRGIAVMLDFITNHTGADCSWVSRHPSWYMEAYSPDYSDAALFKWNDPDPELEAEMLHVMEYWIHTANIDGYRFDTVSPTREGGVTLDFFSKTLPELRKRCPGRKLIFLAESARPETLGAGFDLNYGWHYLDMLEALFAGTKAVADLFATNTEEWDGVAKYGTATTTRMRHSTNHDHAAKASPLENYNSLEGSLAAFVLASTMGGVPLVYSSQEIGYPTKLSFFKTGAKVMDWTSGKSTNDTYKSLFKLGDSMTLRKGSISRIANTDVVSFTREYGGETILVLVNVRGTSSAFNLSGSLYDAAWKDFFSGKDYVFTSRSIEGYGYKVLIKK